MNAAPAMPRTGFKFMIAVNKGPDKGVSYQLLPPQVTIGRGPENNVTLTDPRVSRQAAVIEFSMEKITIKDVSKRGALSVNGESIDHASIVDGDVIRMGETEMIFMVEALPLPAPKPAGPRFDLVSPGGAGPMAAPPSSFEPPGGFERPRRTPRAPSAGGSGKLRFYIIVGLVLGLLGWLLSSENAQKKPEPTLRSVEDIEKDIETSEKRQEELAKRRQFKNDEEKTRYEEANRHYLEGFRDFQKGQYGRALRSFETARAIDPEHSLAKRYYKLAEKQRDETIAMLTLEGRRYKEKHMFSRCSAAFEKVLDFIPNKEDLKYKQAEALKKECDLLMDDKFQ